MLSQSKIDPRVSLGAVKLKVQNLERSLAFYTSVVGFKILSAEGNSALLTTDGKKPLVELEEHPDALPLRPLSAAGLFHFAIVVPERRDLGVVLRRLAEAGIQIAQGDHWVSEALYLSDPDKNGIEIYWDRPRSEWEYDDNGYVRMGSGPVDIAGLLRLSEGEKWNGLPEDTIMGHLNLHIADLEQSRHFYSDLIGFDVSLDATYTMDAVFVSAGGYHHHFVLNIWAGRGASPPPENATGLQYGTIVFPTEESRSASVQRLTEGGTEVREAGNGDKEVTDPSGIRLRLILDSEA